MTLDHLVVNARFDIDAAATLFAQLGFTVTPRGYHTLGSVNHTIVFDDHYLELVGLPADGKTIREEIVASPIGPEGLVFRSDDAQRTCEWLGRAGFDAGSPQTFSRPVEPFGDARFTTVRLAPGQLPGGRVYFCQHLTPELVFREQWRSHANGAYALAQLHLIGADREAYERLGEPASGFSLSFWTRADFVARFGAAAARIEDRSPRFAAITVRTPQWRETGTRAIAAGLPVEIDAMRSIVALPRFDMLLEFIP